ncbi:hypothetical protein IF1G_04182 [Cordyceps javanica]|uniref:Transmembrane protein n=1 Tax=Cordyceps javanica TaxID=43265 RepID=A0A545W2J7_9HYPO|nr:hypothetical protein IF1G_04182 [Cordyceps javanica]TQW08199.1 growth arrest and DNA-damage-inducible proteins-interacting protein 1 domain-containing protein [Cordyceps javanica]
MHLPARPPRDATAYAEGLIHARELVRRDVSSAAIAVGGFFGLFAVVAVVVSLMTYYSKRQARQKSRTQGYESTTTADTTELATSAATNVTAPQPAQTAAGSSVDRHTSVRSVMTLPAYRPEASNNEQVLGRAGDRDGVDVIVDLPTEEQEETLRDEEMEALYQIRNLRRQQIVEREQRRVEREEARARNDRAALADIRQRSRIAREQILASNETISELRQDATRAQGQRVRSVSTVSYGDLGVARHDGSRVRASSNDSERMGLLADAASIGEAQPESLHHRNRSVTSFMSADSGPPSPAYSRENSTPGPSAANSGSGGGGGGGDSPLAGSSPDLVEVPLDFGGEDRPPPGYDEAASPSTGSHPVTGLPPGYTEGSSTSSLGSHSGELQAPADASRSQRSGSFTGPVPQIVIDRHPN